MSADNDPVFQIEDDRIYFPTLTDVSSLEEKPINFPAPAPFSQKNEPGGLRPVQSLDEVDSIAQNSAEMLKALISTSP